LRCKRYSCKVFFLKFDILLPWEISTLIYSHSQVLKHGFFDENLPFVWISGQKFLLATKSKFVEKRRKIRIDLHFDSLKLDKNKYSWGHLKNVIFSTCPVFTKILDENRKYRKSWLSSEADTKIYVNEWQNLFPTWGTLT